MLHGSQQLPHSDLTEKVIAAFFETASELGCGFSERVYQRSLQVVLLDKCLQAEIDVPVSVYFRGERSVASSQM